MPAKSKQVAVNGSRQEENALQRVLRLPVVSSACDSLQRTYATTKESHPLVASMCGAYERGIQAAGALALWSVKPVVQKLEPQFAAANALACQGLDLLEQRIPGLHKPVEEVISELKDSISTHVQRTMPSLADALDRILGLAAERCEQAQNTMRDVAEDARSSKVGHLVEAGVDTAIGKLENVVDLLLPKPERNSAHDRSEAHVSREGSPSSIFGRISAAACNVTQHAYRQTTQTIQYTRDKGQEWAMWIPGLGGLARQSSNKAQQVFSNAQDTASGCLSNGQRKVPEKKSERKNEDGRTSMAKENAETLSLRGGLTQSLQTASLSGAKEAHSIACKAAGMLLHLFPHRAVSEMSAKAGLLWGILQDVTGSFLGTVFHYMPVKDLSCHTGRAEEVPRLSAKEEGTATGTADGSKTYRRRQESKPATPNTQEKEAHYRRRSIRGHYPFSFVNLDEPHLEQQAPVQCRSPALEADYTSARKSASHTYKEVSTSRRFSEGLYHSSPEPAYSKAYHPGLYGTILKKD